MFEEIYKVGFVLSGSLTGAMLSGFLEGKVVITGVNFGQDNSNTGGVK